MEWLLARTMELTGAIYAQPILSILEKAQIGVYTAWIVALALLVTKLLWKPLDSATTYGKLLSKKNQNTRDEDKTEGSANSEAEINASQQAAPSLSSQVAAQSTSVGVLTQRLAFTSSYFLGLLLALCATLTVLALLAALTMFLHLPSPRGCPNLASSNNPVVTEQFDSTVTQFPMTMNGARIQMDKKDVRFVESPLLEAAGIVEPQHVDGKKGASDLIFDQSLCSLVTHWTRNKISLWNTISEDTLIEAVMLCLSNVWTLRIGFMCALLSIHLSRRLFECLAIQTFSPRSISLHNLLLMWAYYIFMPVALLVDLAAKFTKVALDRDIAGLTMPSLVSIATGLELFLMASVFQFAAHRTLAKIRSPSSGNSKYAYSVPKGGLFDFVSCPHYLAEMLIYASFALVSGGTPSSLLLLTFVCITMVSQGIKTHHWYLQTFNKEKLSGRKAIIPFLL